MTTYQFKFPFMKRRVMCSCGFEFWTAGALVKHMRITDHKRVVSIPMLKRRKRMRRGAPPGK